MSAEQMARRELRPDAESSRFGRSEDARGERGRYSGQAAAREDFAPIDRAIDRCVDRALERATDRPNTQPTEHAIELPVEACAEEIPATRPALVLELFEKYHDRVYLFVRRSMETSTAEDITQDVFTRLLKADGLEKKTLTASYLIKIADNLIKRRYRRGQRFDQCVETIARTQRAQESEAARVSGWGGSARGGRDTRTGEISAKAIAEHMRQLGPAEREAVRLIVCEGLSYSQAAEAMGARVTSVNNWKFRGIQRLKKHAGVEAGERRRGPSPAGREAG